MSHKIVILGSTGSIGTQTLDVVRNNPDRLKVMALATGKNTELLEKQIREFHPLSAAVFDEKAAADLKERVRDLPVKIVSGMDGLIELARMQEADTVVTALVGMIGIRPTVAAIEAGKDIALANKETLVAAGEIIMPLAGKYGVQLLPVDSEHSAIFQCLKGEQKDGIEEILLTASGGAFRGKKKEDLIYATKEDALKHPNWVMGLKITVDSATLVNKGLEVIEAMHLFQVPVEKIHVLIQPTSVVHSMVRFTDGSVMAQMGPTDMRIPIQVALFHPERVSSSYERIDFAKLHDIVFEEPDTETFRGLPLAFAAAKAGGTMPAVFNAAGEEAVKLFLKDRIHFLDMYDIIEDTCGAHKVISAPSLSDIFSAEQEAREHVLAKWDRHG